MIAPSGYAKPLHGIQPRLNDTAARSGTVTNLAITAAGMCVEAILGQTVPNMPIWPSLASAVLATALLGWTLTHWRSMDRRASSLLFLVNAAAVIAAFYVTNPYYAALGSKWSPFQGAKLGCLITAMLAPSQRVGILVIVGNVGLVIFQFLTFPMDVRLNLAAGEPWATVAFGIAGCLIVWNRLYRLDVERLAIATKLEFDAAQELARIALRLRDSLNTPLQTIEFSIELLRKKDPNNESIAIRMKDALETLKKTNDTLVQYEKKIAWRTEDIAFTSVTTDAENSATSVDKAR